MNLRSFSLRQYGLLLGAALLLFMVLSVWWTTPPEDEYSRTQFRANETGNKKRETVDATVPSTIGESEVATPQAQQRSVAITAKSEEAEVRYRRGQQYLHGEGVSQNAQEAAKLFRLAAKQGHAGAQYDWRFCGGGTGFRVAACGLAWNDGNGGQRSAFAHQIPTSPSPPPRS